jgi:hypothetical protein
MPCARRFVTALEPAFQSQKSTGCFASPIKKYGLSLPVARVLSAVVPGEKDADLGLVVERFHGHLGDRRREETRLLNDLPGELEVHTGSVLPLGGRERERAKGSQRSSTDATRLRR